MVKLETESILIEEIQSILSRARKLAKMAKASRVPTENIQQKYFEDIVRSLKAIATEYIK